MLKKHIYIKGYARTPNGSFLGQLSSVPATKLGAVAIKGALAKGQIDPKEVHEVFMGHVIQAGTGQAPARQAAIFSGLSEATPCTTVNKVCGSGLQAIILGAMSISSGEIETAVCGGMENMSLAPHIIPQMRNGHKFGETKIKDSMQWDGLWDVYSDRAMGNCAEECAKKFHISRQEQDEFAITSFKRSQAAIKEGHFKNEIAPVTIANKKGDIIVDTDEGPGKANFEKIPTLPPAFEKEGSITAANASTINDGAAAVVLSSDSRGAQYKIMSWASHAAAPTWFTTAPIEAMRKCAAKAQITLDQVDLFEINEAFALVPLVAMKELSLSHQKVNIFGGGVSLGHPIGASGARIVVTLVNAMTVKNAKRGMASICIGGGEALAVLIERL